MREVMALAAARNLAVIEDAAQAPGSIVQGRKAGTWGDAAVISFGGSKLLSAGRGGALLTNRADVYQRARTWCLRGNWLCPLSELQAAVLLPQLAQLDARNEQRARAVAELTGLLKDVPGLRPFCQSVADSRAGYYKLGFQYDAAAFGLSRRRLVCAVRAEGIALDEGFPALHAGRSAKRFRAVGDLSEAMRAHDGTVILHHPVLLGVATELAEVRAAVEKVRKHAERLREDESTTE
jgi:dTDP-4-amino-4,6-dideoxygalactose transaminase